MNAKELLNMDMETAIQWLLHFWRWWTDELTWPCCRPNGASGCRGAATRSPRCKGDALVYRNDESGADPGRQAARARSSS